MPNYTVRVGNHAETPKSYGVLVDFHIDKEKGMHSAGRLEWFTKSLCTLEKVEVKDRLPEYYLTAPEWLLKQKKVKYEL
ncbi:hypothetical protein [Flavobacterium sp. FlaQc-50]|uniref:hypothetical protein n=1 Tax=unclassified Flavobacterium TaxID=196869 RepID=UPI00375801BE